MDIITEGLTNGQKDENYIAIDILRMPGVQLKGIIPSGLRRFISSKEIFPRRQFYFSDATVLC